MAPSPMHIGLSAWIIQDGNYDDFACGELRRFALEFYPARGLRAASGEAPGLVHLDNAMYSAGGRVCHAGPDAWVVDFGGVMAFRDEAAPSWAREGALVAGDVYLGIDPFFYFERLYKLPGVPPLIYEWRIEAIDMDSTPFVDSIDEKGRAVKVRDESRKGRVPIPATDGWKDDREYVLHCTMTQSVPMRTRE
ncbi:MAG TPA: hypothetical protein PKE29_12330 [Phycisphaerales bacterium]|nr:hypothetical protein [Phycisphaerales bacterium]